MSAQVAAGRERTEGAPLFEAVTKGSHERLLGEVVEAQQVVIRRRWLDGHASKP